MDHAELKRLESQIPPGDPSIGIFHALEPLQWRIVQSEGEWGCQEVIPEGVDHPPDRQTLLLHRIILRLSDSFD